MLMGDLTMLCEATYFEICPSAKHIGHAAPQKKASSGPFTAQHGQRLNQLLQELSSCVSMIWLSLCYRFSQHEDLGQRTERYLLHSLLEVG